MRYNIGEEYTMKRNYSHLIEGETVTIIKRTKKGKYTSLDVCNCNNEIYKAISYKLLKKKKSKLLKKKK